MASSVTAAASSWQVKSCVVCRPLLHKPLELCVRYDTREGLIAKGILPESEEVVEGGSRLPRPVFPAPSSNAQYELMLTDTDGEELEHATTQDGSQKWYITVSQQVFRIFLLIHAHADIHCECWRDQRIQMVVRVFINGKSTDIKFTSRKLKPAEQHEFELYGFPAKKDITVFHELRFLSSKATAAAKKARREQHQRDAAAAASSEQAEEEHLMRNLGIIRVSVTRSTVEPDRAYEVILRGSSNSDGEGGERPRKKLKKSAVSGKRVSAPAPTRLLPFIHASKGSMATVGAGKQVAYRATAQPVNKRKAIEALPALGVDDAGAREERTLLQQTADTLVLEETKPDGRMADFDAMIDLSQDDQPASGSQSQGAAGSSAAAAASSSQRSVAKVSYRPKAAKSVVDVDEQKEEREAIDVDEQQPREVIEVDDSDQHIETKRASRRLTAAAANARVKKEHASQKSSSSSNEEASGDEKEEDEDESEEETDDAWQPGDDGHWRMEI